MPRAATSGLSMKNDDGRNARMSAEKMDAIGQFDVPNSSSELDRKKKAPPLAPALKGQTDPNAKTEGLAAAATETSAQSTVDAVELGKPVVLSNENLVLADDDDKVTKSTAPNDDVTEDVEAPPVRQKRGPVVKIEALEIDMENPKALFDVAIEEDDDDDDDDDEIARDMERLLVQTSSSAKHAANTKSKSSSKKNSSQSSSSSSCFNCCTKQQQLKRRRIGNVSIVFPGLYQRTGGWGVVGPHWFGPPCVILLLLFASSFFIQRATTIGPITTAVCLGFTFMTAFNLCNAAFRDPGIVLAEDQQSLDLTNYRWCDFCNAYQPPDGAHCPDCNVCVAGYDHHCVWMGTCIGRKNFRQFVAFNLSWLFYLGYAIVWVTFAGPAIYKKH